MNRFCHRVAPIAVAILTVAVAPVWGQVEGSDAKAIMKRLDAIQKQLDEQNTSLKKAFKKVQEDIDDIKKGVKNNKDKNTELELSNNVALNRIDKLEKDVAELKKQIITANKPAPNGTGGGGSTPQPGTLTTLTKRVSDLESKVDGLTKKLEGLTGRISGFGAEALAESLGLNKMQKQLDELKKELTNLNGGTQSSNATTGNIVLVNDSNDLMLFLIEDVSYRVQPRSRRTITEVSPGAISYEVIAYRVNSLGANTVSSGTRNSQVRAGKNLTITVR